LAASTLEQTEKDYEYLGSYPEILMDRLEEENNALRSDIEKSHETVRTLEQCLVDLKSEYDQALEKALEMQKDYDSKINTTLEYNKNLEKLTQRIENTKEIIQRELDLNKRVHVSAGNYPEWVLNRVIDELNGNRITSQVRRTL